MFSRWSLRAFAAAAVLLAACASAPVQTMSDARQTIQAAEAAGADKVAPQSLAAARDGLKRAQERLDAHDYRGASREATAARQSAAEALAATQQQPN